MGDALTSSNPNAVALYDEAGNRVTLVGGTVASGQLPVKFHSTTGATTTVSVPTTAGGISVLATNTSRKGATLYNESGSAIYVLLGAGTVSATVYTVQMAVGAYYEAPYGFNGAITAIAASSTTTVRATEFT
jgi:hypothetical protein